jgi:hypothetical protein
VGISAQWAETTIGNRTVVLIQDGPRLSAHFYDNISAWRIGTDCCAVEPDELLNIVEGLKAK